jgi:SUN domain-containing protein 1/2
MTTRNSLQAHIYKAFFFSPGNLPAITALMPWSEAGQCWCAARNQNGLAQLGVTTKHTIRAEAVTIEHAAQGSTLDIKSAPEWVEFWGEVEMGNFDVPEAVGCTTGAPALGWVCLGRTRYDINAVSNVQTAELAVKVVPARRFVVRVTSNHGRDYTCLYRVQVHGEVVE